MKNSRIKCIPIQYNQSKLLLVKKEKKKVGDLFFEPLQIYQFAFIWYSANKLQLFTLAFSLLIQMSVEQGRSSDYTTSDFIMKLLGSMPELNQDRISISRKQAAQQYSNPSLKNIENSVESGNSLKDISRSSPAKIKTNSKEMQLFRMFYEIVVSRLMDKKQADDLWKMFEISIDQQNKFTSFLKTADGVVSQSAKIKEKRLQKIKEQLNKIQNKQISEATTQKAIKQADQAVQQKQKKREKRMLNSRSDGKLIDKRNQLNKKAKIENNRKTITKLKSEGKQQKKYMLSRTCLNPDKAIKQIISANLRIELKNQIKNVVKLIQHGHKFLHK